MKKFFDEFFIRIFSWIINNPWVVISLLLIITISAGLQLPKMKIVTDLKSLLPRDEIYKNDERIRDAFNIKDLVIIGVKNKKSVFNTDTFEYIKALIDKIELLNGVYKVRSLFSEDNISNTPEESLIIAPFVKKIDPKSVENSMKQIKNFEAVQGILVSKDFTLATILVELEDDAAKSRIYFEIKKTIVEEPPENEDKIYISGMPVFEGVLGDYMLQDFLVMIPIVSIIIIVFLYLTYRSFLLVGVSLIMIFVVDIWTLGFMAFLGQPLYLIQCVMPVILMALSVADEIHIFGRYFEECRDSSSSVKDRIIVVMQEMWRPVILTSITTSFGFLALVMTSMKPLQYFGIFTAFGIIGAMLFALLATPVALILFGNNISYKTSYITFDKSLAKMGGFLFKNLTCIRILIVIIMAISFMGMSKVFIQDNWLSNFKKSSEVYIEDKMLNAILSGTNILNLELDTGMADGIKNPEFLKKVAKFQKQLNTIDWIGGSISFAQIIEKMNSELNGKHEIPDSRNAIAQYLLLLDGSTYERFWDHLHQKIAVTIFIREVDYIGGTIILSEIKSFLNKYLPDTKTTFGGEYMLTYHWVDLLKVDQIKSFLTSLILIFLVSSGVFWSFRKGVVVTAPIIMAVMINYGIMGFCGIPLSVSVSVCSSIILGIGIDYAIHLQNKFDVLRNEMDLEDAFCGIFRTAGKAIVWNAVVVIAGFLTLIFSQIPPNQKLGLVCSLGIATSLFSSFLVVPVFLISKNIKH